MSTSDPAPSFWAKLTDESAQYHPLVAHSADVAAVLHALTEPGTALHEGLVCAAGPDTNVNALRATLIYLAALHDMGKANHGFQDKKGPWAQPDRRWPANGHVIPVIASLDGRGPFLTMIQQLIDRLPFDGAGRKDAFLTTIAHHGRPWVSDPASRATGVWAQIWAPHPDHGRDPLREIERLGGLARQWSGLRDDRTRLPWPPALSNLFAGLLTISDWIGSTDRIFTYAPEADDDPDAYWERARENAVVAVRQIGIRPSPALSASSDDVYRKLFPDVFPRFEPTKLQQLVGKLDLPKPGTRMVIESETGSGKTEAALALYAKLRSAAQVDGMVFALPTRATAKAMYDRVRSSVVNLHPDGALPPMALAMGGAVGEGFGASDAALDPDLYPDNEDRARHRWSSENHKKFFAAEVVVGTIDQILLAGLPIRHAHVRLALLSRHLIVIDEIHSYDRYMNTVLNRVLEYHASLGGVSAFLSATLSRAARNGLAGGEVDIGLDESVEAPYPALSTHDPSSGRWSQERAATQGRPKSVSWALRSQETLGDEIFTEAMRIAAEGGRVCILRNTVRQARTTVDRLKAMAPELLWRPGLSELTPAYHSRFIPADRSHLDAAALSDFGKESTRQGVILVSTQVIEQSLDVDFDWMMTDLAPVDVLLQRIGRLHRHDRSSRPSGAERAAVLVQAPQGPFPAQREYRGNYGWGSVYAEVSDLELTRRLIVARPEILIPRDNRLLVEHVYHPDGREKLGSESPEWNAAVDAAEGRRLALDMAGGMGALTLGRGYSEQAVQYNTARGDHIRTRIGDDRISVALDRAVSGWFDPDATADGVALRLKSLSRAGDVDLAEPTATFERDTAEGPTYRVGEKLVLRYGPEGWVEIWD